MSVFPWLPIGTALADGVASGRLLDGGADWQLCDAGQRTALLLQPGGGPDWWAAELAALAQATPVIEIGGLACVLLARTARPVTLAGLALRNPAINAEQAEALIRAVRALAVRQPRAGWSSALFLPQQGFALGTTEVPDEDRRATLVAALSGGVGHGGLSVAGILQLNPRLNPALIQAALDLVSHRPAASPDGFVLPGQPALQAILREQVLDVLYRPAEYARLGVNRPGGVLLAGPPGCGKSFAAARIAAFLGWPLHAISVANVGSMWLHETPRLLAQAFAAASAQGPAIVLLEELDALGKARGGSAPAAEEVNTLLIEVEAAPKRNLLVIATTNRLDAIDPALRRRGRFDVVFTMDYPDGSDTAAILSALLDDRPHAAGLDVAGLAQRLARRPVSDLLWVVDEAARMAVRAGRDSIDDLLLARAAGQLSLRSS